MEPMDQNLPQKTRVKTSTQFRVAFAMVIVISIATAALGAVQISRTLKAPFQARVASKQESTSEEERKQELKSLDTDYDGLSDYDETYLYTTSPFIEDSDSDGEKDGDEVKGGDDPNCPKDRNCFTSIEVGATSTPILDPLGAQPQLFGGGSLGLNLEPTLLRQELEKLGVPKMLLDKLKDDDLQKLYSETLQEVAATSPGR